MSEDMKTGYDDFATDDADQVYRNVKTNENRHKFMKDRAGLFRLGILAGILTVVLFYLSSASSKVKFITVEGNSILPDDYILEMSGISTRSIYYLTFPGFTENKIVKDPLIESCDVKMIDNNSVKILVTEKKVYGYRYDEEPVILMTDGTQAPLKAEYLNITAKVPLITGFTDDEQTRKLSRGFGDVEQTAISQIAEVSQYALRYDEEALKILMRSGGYVIASYYNVDLLNQYNDIYVRQQNKKACIFFADMSDRQNGRSAYASTCPWDEGGDAEYWTDEKGSVIVNPAGIAVIKNYYTFSDGSYAYDKDGNRIPIPIDEQGKELYDEDFVENYQAGYYATGKLVLPE